MLNVKSHLKDLSKSSEISIWNLNPKSIQAGTLGLRVSGCATMAIPMYSG